MKKITFFASILILTFALSTSEVIAQSNNGNNGNVITIDDGITYVWAADNCIIANVPALSQRLQYSSKGFVSISLTFQLPEGHCDIPARGTRVTRYGKGSWAVIHADGFVKVKFITNGK